MKNMRKTKFVASLAAVLLLFAGTAQSSAAITTGSWFMDQSNEFGAILNYGQVDISADSSTGVVTWTVDVFDVGNQTSFGGNFGIQAFGFNIQNLSGSNQPGDWNITLPTGWSQNSGGGNMDGFGDFVVTEDGTGTFREDPLFFTIEMAGGSEAEAVASNFALLSGGGGGMNVFFAAHVAGFDSGIPDPDNPGDNFTSHFIGGSTPVPAPGAFLLGAMGLSLVGWLKRRVA